VVLTLVSLVHFKNMVTTGVTALLNEPLCKTVKLVKQWIRACLYVHGVLGLSERSLVDHLGTQRGMLWALVTVQGGGTGSGVPGGWGTGVMGGGW